MNLNKYNNVFVCMNHKVCKVIVKVSLLHLFFVNNPLIFFLFFLTMETKQQQKASMCFISFPSNVENMITSVAISIMFFVMKNIEENKFKKNKG